MKILHVITGMARAAGTSVFCGEALRALAERGHDCRLWVRHAAPDDYPTPAPILTAPPTDWRPDVVHIHALWTPWLFRAFLWAKRRRIPVVWSPHGMLAPWAMAHKRWKKVLPWWLYQRSALRHANLLHATTDLEARWIRDLGFRLPIAEVPLGTDFSAGGPPLAARPHSVLFVGRIYPVKGLDLLLRAWATLAPALRDEWRLVLVGPDQAGHRAELLALAQTLGLNTQVAALDSARAAEVTFTGPLYGKDKVAAYHAAQLLVLPSHTENFGVIIPDALASGMPAIASAATPWVILAERGCGAQFELTPESLAATLTRFLSLTDAERQAMGERGQALVRERYTWPAIGHALESAYQSILPKDTGDTP